ncbi:MAG: CoA-binding protein [Candidatus Omnitrophica bacterium]|nr:CoA-binding protein [Candidatus Omnitrophota bacterium]
MHVAVIGASNKPERYAYQAVKLLREKGHTVFPIHPRIEEIEGLRVYPKITDIPEKIDTVTLYVGAIASAGMAQDILNCRPRRIIFNPGAENDHLEKQAKEAGIQTVRGCTLVMLKTGQF